MEMIVFLYRWKIKPGFEKQFEENWALVTKAIRDQCGSYGSRVHVNDHGDYIGYAQWPNAETRERCHLGSESAEARILMREAVEKSYPDETLKVQIDLLVSRLLP